MDFESIYKQQMGEIRFSENFCAETAELLKQAADKKERKNMKKSVKILIAAVLITVVLSVTAFAISSLLSARDVAQKLGESYAADSFEQQEFVSESVTDKGYTVSFLGAVKGERFVDAGAEAECSYFVVSVASADGSALSLINGNPLGISIIIEGYPAWQVNTWSLNTSAVGTEENGVLYYLYTCENLEIFADRNVYLAVYEGFIPGLDIITMNSDGTFNFAESYSGFKAMFKLPLDPEKADPEAAAEILKEFLVAEQTEILKTEQTENPKGEYEIEYIGRKSGIELGVTEDDECEFYVYAVNNSDGTPLSINHVPLEMQPVIKGCPVWAVNGYRLNTCPSIKEKNGTIYYLYNCDDLDVFADREVYLFAVESGAPYLEIIELENDGSFSISDNYEGWGTIIEMNLDTANADKEKADIIIAGLMPDSSEKWNRT